MNRSLMSSGSVPVEIRDTQLLVNFDQLVLRMISLIIGILISTAGLISNELVNRVVSPLLEIRRVGLFVFRESGAEFVLIYQKSLLIHVMTSSINRTQGTILVPGVSATLLLQLYWRMNIWNNLLVDDVFT